MRKPSLWHQKYAIGHSILRGAGTVRAYNCALIGLVPNRSTVPMAANRASSDAWTRDRFLEPIGIDKNIPNARVDMSA